MFSFYFIYKKDRYQVIYLNFVIKDSFLLEFPFYKKFISTNFSNLFDFFNNLFKNEH